MKLEDFFSVNERLSFALEDDVEAERYSCLVKKLKAGLLAFVVSNRDKSRLRLAPGDTLYFFPERDDETWLLRLKVAQTQAFPLIIASMAAEPAPLSHRQVKPPAPMGNVERVDDDHLSHIPDLEPEPRGRDDEAKEPWAGEAPIAARQPPPVGAMSVEDIEEITMSDLDAAGEAGDQLPAGAVPTPFEDLPEIDTSELEAELDADIEASLAGIERPTRAERVETQEPQAAPPGTHDDIDEMTLAREGLDMGELDESPPPIAVESAAAPSMGAARFEDFFGLRLIPLTPPEAEHAGELLLRGAPAPLLAAAKDDNSILTRLDYLEGLLRAALSGGCGGGDAICLALEPGAIAVVTERPLQKGGRLLALVNRPWRPSLAFDAVVRVARASQVQSEHVALLEIEAISTAGAASIARYLAGREAGLAALRAVVDGG